MGRTKDKTGRNKMTNEAKKIILSMQILSGRVTEPTQEDYKLLGIEHMVPINPDDLEAIAKSVIGEFIDITHKISHF
jgi:hypothetical protein